MRLVACLLLVSIQAPWVNGQEQTVDPDQAFWVEIVEFRIPAVEAELPKEMGDIAKDFEEQLKAGNFEIYETVQLEAIAGKPTRVMFGKTVNVVTGVSNRNGIETKMMTQQKLGIGVNVTVQPQGDGGIDVSLEYQASRLLPTSAEDEPPEIDAIQMETTTSVVPQQRKFLSARTNDKRGYLLLKVSPVR